MVSVDFVRTVKLENTEFGSAWERTRLMKMVKPDSVLRESMRISSFVSKAFTRKVTAAEGMTLPNGTHIPRGTTVCVNAYPIHHDEEIYPEPFEFVL